MCIRDGAESVAAKDAYLVERLRAAGAVVLGKTNLSECCLLYTSDAADDLLCADLGGRRNIQKKPHLTLTYHFLRPHHSARHIN